MAGELEKYYKNLSDSYAMYFEQFNKSSIALTLIKGIALDFEFDVYNFIDAQMKKGKNEEEKEQLRKKANEKVSDKLERVNILRNCILTFESVIGREQQLKSIVGAKNIEITEHRLRIKELEEKIFNMEQYLETINE